MVSRRHGLKSLQNQTCRRLRPSIFDTDWLLLGRLSGAVSQFVQTVTYPGQVAVDFGCGSQPYRRLFEARGVEYRGADFDEASDIPISPQGTVAAIDSSADLVLSFQVLEHVRDVGTYLAEARRLLRPDGILLLSTHGTWLYHPHPEDHRRWTREGLISELSCHGFEVVDCHAVVGPLAWTTIIRLTGFSHALRSIPVIGRLAGSILAVVMNLRAALEDRLTPARITHDNACVYLVQARVLEEGSA